MIICLEGIDGCGKGTQADLLLKTLREHDNEVGLLKLPDYGSPLGSLIDAWLHGKGYLASPRPPGTPTGKQNGAR